MNARRRVSTLVVSLALLVAIAAPVLAESWSGNSWMSHFIGWHYAHSRTTYVGSGEHKIQADTKMYRNGEYRCGDSVSAIIDGSDDRTAACTHFTLLPYTWEAKGKHWIWTWPDEEYVWYGTSSGS